jgi:hypothetical protein
MLPEPLLELQELLVSVPLGCMSEWMLVRLRIICTDEPSKDLPSFLIGLVLQELHGLRQ